MYAELIENITPDDRKALADKGVPSSRISEWKSGLRFPTRPQVIALATVKKIDYIELERELMLLETEAEAAKKPAMKALLDHARSAGQLL